MKEHFIDLTDGTRLEIKMNFGTLYYLQKCRGFYRLVKKVEKAEKSGTPKEKAISKSESFDMAAYIIYAVLRSNGRPVNFDEALQLVPPDTDNLTEMIRGFQEEYKKYSKKKRAKTSTMPA